MCDTIDVMNETLERYLTIKSPAQIEKMREAGRVAAEILRLTADRVEPGITTGELDRIAHKLIVDRDAIAASLGYRGFPRSICTSVDNVVCHGIPNDKEKLKEGSIINLDIAVIVDGWYGDNSVTVAVGKCDDAKLKLMRVAKECMERAIAMVKPGLRTRELGAIIEDHARANGFTSVKEFVGHGIGWGYHEPPQILHYRNTEPCIRLRPGMTFTIEPMINAGTSRVVLDQKDGWTVRTADNSPSAQFEHTILVTESGHEILTR